MPVQRKNPKRPKGRITDQQRVFLKHLLETGNRKEAAITAGVKEHRAEKQANDWLCPSKYPHLHAEYSLMIQRQNSRAEFSADELLRQIQLGAFLDYRAWFVPDVTDEGAWIITKEHYEQLPVDVARLIERAVHVYTYHPETGEPQDTGKYRVWLIDRKTMIQLTARHMLGDKLKVDQSVVQINWNEMTLTNLSAPVQDIVEERIRGAALLSLPANPSAMTRSSSMNPPASMTDSITQPSSVSHLPVDPSAPKSLEEALASIGSEESAAQASGDGPTGDRPTGDGPIGDGSSISSSEGELIKPQSILIKLPAQP